VRDTGFEALLMDLGFGPDERFGIFIVVGNEGIDVLAKFGNGGEGCIPEGFSSQDREPDFDLVEPGGVRGREVEVDIRMALEPTIGFRLVSIEVIEDDVKSGVGVKRISAALAANLGSLLSHQDFRLERSIFCALRKRQTY
jgi:hypothetical protein